MLRTFVRYLCSRGKARGHSRRETVKIVQARWQPRCKSRCAPSPSPTELSSICCVAFHLPPGGQTTVEDTGRTIAQTTKLIYVVRRLSFTSYYIVQAKLDAAVGFVLLMRAFIVKQQLVNQGWLRRQVEDSLADLQ